MMFNIGLLGAKKDSFVRLYDYEIPVSSAATNFVLNRAGGASAYIVVVPGMWWLGPADPFIGDSHQCRVTLEAGSANRLIGSLGNWGASMSNGDGISLASGQRGRVLIEIRKSGDTQILASCRVWRGPYAP